MLGVEIEDRGATVVSIDERGEVRARHRVEVSGSLSAAVGAALDRVRHPGRAGQADPGDSGTPGRHPLLGVATLATDSPAVATALAELSVRLGGSETEDQWRGFLERTNAVALGAVSDGRVVGYAAGEVRPGFGLPASVGWVETFGVELEHRGEGTGRHLLSELLRRFADAGVDRVYTLVPLHDPVLGPFFRQYGFRDEPLVCLGVTL